MSDRFIRKVFTSTGHNHQDDDSIYSTEVAWLRSFRKNEFYRLPSDFKLVSHPKFQSGEIVGMDAASVATVWAMDLNKPNLTCLDMCCAPGMKLALIEEVLLSLETQTGTLVETESKSVGDLGIRDKVRPQVYGTDINESRLRVCRNLLSKLKHFDLKSRIFIIHDEIEQFESFIERTKKRRHKKKRKQVIEFPRILFDRVLVDVECTHDGSVRHVEKNEGDSVWGNRKFYDTDEKIVSLVELQKSLIVKGFNSCKPGGLIVYSTCSLQPRQNSQVVEYLFESFPDAIPGKLPFDFSKVPATQLNEYSCLFDPEASGTSGQYISVIRKRDLQSH